MIDAKPFRGLRFGELDDDLDIVIFPLEGACEVLRPLSSSDQPAQPRTVCLGQRLASLIPVALVGVNAADDDVISQDRFSGDIAGGGCPDPSVTATDACETDDASVRNSLY